VCEEQILEEASAEGLMMLGRVIDLLSVLGEYSEGLQYRSTCCYGRCNHTKQYQLLTLTIEVPRASAAPTPHDPTTIEASRLL